MAPNKSAPMKIIIQQGTEGQKRGKRCRGVHSIEAWTQSYVLEKNEGNNNHAHFQEYRVGEERLRGKD